MPRTKVSRNTKRNRDAAKDEALSARLREFDSFVDQYLSELDMKHQQRLEGNRAINNMIRMLPQKILSMKVSDLMNIDARTIDEVNVVMENKATANRSMVNSSLLKSSKKKSRDDEGYLTEDSASNVNTASSLGAFSTRAGATAAPSRPVGPLSSAKAKARVRRSRSACGYLSTISSSSSTQSTSRVQRSNSVVEKDRKSRSKMRTVLHNRIKANSCDRANPVTPKICPNTPLSMLRYPRIGETVISLTGSPVVCQSISDSTANVNIPMRDGVLSVRPTRIESLDRDFIQRIDSETLSQIKQLQSNLNIIMSIADSAYTDSKM